MIEIKLNNGDVVKNLDDASFAKWVFKTADLIKDQVITESELCRWLGNEYCEGNIVGEPELQDVPEWKDTIIERFNRKE